MKTITQWLFKILVTLFAVTFLSFLFMQISPIDPAETYIRLNSIVVDEGLLMKLREEMGLNQPLIQQYGNWVYDILHLDFGISLVWKKPVLNLFLTTLPKSLLLLFLSILIQCVFSLLFGYLLYRFNLKKSTFVSKVILIVGVSTPSFLIGIFLIDLLGTHLKLISITNSGYLLPAICIAIAPTCFYSKMLYTELECKMEEPWVDYSRSRGLHEQWILRKQVLPLAIRTLIPSFLQSSGRILAGMGIVETVFSFQGFGNLLFRSILQRDIPIVHASVLLLAFTVLSLDLVAELTRKQLYTNQRNSKEVIG